MRTPGSVQIFSRDGRSPELHAIFGKDWLVRGRGGYMYVVTCKVEGEVGQHVTLSLRQVVDDSDDMYGPLVSRRRYSLFDEMAAEIALRRGVASVTDNGNGTETVTVPEGFSPTDDDLAAFLPDGWPDLWRGELLLGWLYDICEQVGVTRDGAKTIAIAADEPRDRPDMSTAEVLDEVWRDDDWEATVDQVRAEADSAGYAMTEEAAKKALQRGPYRQVRPAQGRGGGAIWRRDPTVLTGGAPEGRSGVGS